MKQRNEIIYGGIKINDKPAIKDLANYNKKESVKHLKLKIDAINYLKKIGCEDIYLESWIYYFHMDVIGLNGNNIYIIECGNIVSLEEKLKLLVMKKRKSKFHIRIIHYSYSDCYRNNQIAYQDKRYGINLVKIKKINQLKPYYEFIGESKNQ